MKSNIWRQMEAVAVIYIAVQAFCCCGVRGSSYISGAASDQNRLPPASLFAQPNRGTRIAGVVLRAELERSTVAPGGRVMIKLTMKESGTEVRAVAPSMESRYVLHIKDAKGRQFVTGDTSPQMTMGQKPELQTSEEATTEIDAADYFAFSGPSKYWITAACRIGTTASGTPVYVVSNTVELTVSKGAASIQHLPPASVFAESKRGKPEAGFLLMAELERARVTPGARIAVKLKLRNVGSASGTALAGDHNGYALDIQDPRGRHTIVARPKLAKLPRTLGINTVRPGEELTEEFVVSDYYAFSSAGNYSITAAHLVADSHEAAYVVSNAVLSTVSAERHKSGK